MSAQDKPKNDLKDMPLREETTKEVKGGAGPIDGKRPGTPKPFGPIDG